MALRREGADFAFQRGAGEVDPLPGRVEVDIDLGAVELRRLGARGRRQAAGADLERARELFEAAVRFHRAPQRARDRRVDHAEERHDRRLRGDVAGGGIVEPDRQARFRTVAGGAEGEAGGGELFGLVEDVEPHRGVDEGLLRGDVEGAVGDLPDPPRPRVFERDGEVGGPEPGHA